MHVRTFLSSGYSNKLWASMISGSFSLSEEKIRESTMPGLTQLRIRLSQINNKPTAREVEQ